MEQTTLRKCKKCGRELPLDKFPKTNKMYYRHVCKDCTNEEKRNWNKSRGDKMFEETGFRHTEHHRHKYSLKCGLERNKIKEETGTTYRNEKEAERARSYQKQYDIDHRDDQHYKDTKNRCSRNTYKRNKMKKEVMELDTFFSFDFDLL